MPLIASATQFDFAFNNGAGTWDNNGGADWHFTVTGGKPANEWTMDGACDADAVQVGANGARRLWAGLKGTRLYVATDSAAAAHSVGHPLKVWRFGRLSNGSEPNLRISCL